MSSSLRGYSSRKTFYFVFLTNYEISKNYQKITQKLYNQLTHSGPNWLLLVQLENNPIKIPDFKAVAQKEVDKCKRCSHENSSFELIF